MNYLLTASFLLLVTAPAYYFLLRYSERYGLNRWLLLLGLILVCLLPSVELTSPAPATTITLREGIDLVENNLYPTVVPTLADEAIAAVTEAGSPSQSEVPGPAPLLLLYALGAFLLGSLLVLRTLSLLRLHLRSRPGPFPTDYRLLPANAAPGQAFTFGRRIYLSEDVAADPDLALILAHERVHARQGHTVDILLSELFLCVFWFHPVAWWLRAKLRANLEYLVDATVVRRTNKRDYQLALVRQSIGASGLALALPFSEPTLKGRIRRLAALPRHWAVAIVASLGMVCWLVVGALVVQGEVLPQYANGVAYEEYYQERMPAQIESVEIFFSELPTTDQFLQLQAILTAIPQSDLHVISPEDVATAGRSLQLVHAMNEPVTIKGLRAGEPDQGRFLLGLYRRPATAPTAGQFYPVYRYRKLGAVGNDFERKGILYSPLYDPARMGAVSSFPPDLASDALQVFVNGIRLPLRPSRLLAATIGQETYFEADNGAVVPTDWGEFQRPGRNTFALGAVSNGTNIMELYLKRLPYPSELARLQKIFAQLPPFTIRVYQDCTTPEGHYSLDFTHGNGVIINKKLGESLSPGNHSFPSFEFQYTKESGSGSSAVKRAAPWPTDAPKSDIAVKFNGQWHTISGRKVAAYRSDQLSERPADKRLACLLRKVGGQPGDYLWRASQTSDLNLARLQKEIVRRGYRLNNVRYFVEDQPVEALRLEAVIATQKYDLLHTGVLTEGTDRIHAEATVVVQLLR